MTTGWMGVFPAVTTPFGDAPEAEHDFVRSIKLAEEIMGRGSERVRMPRMTLAGALRVESTAMVEAA